MLAFEIGGDKFKVLFPVLPSKSGNEKAARIQAATMIYHDIKSKCVSAAVLGSRAAFFSYLLLPDGRTTANLETSEFSMLDDLFDTSTKQLESNYIDGEYSEETT